MLRTSLRRAFLRPIRRGSQPHYNEPTGYLYGEKPLPTGQKRSKEAWEYMWLYGMGGSFLIAALGQYYKPDTSMTTWARREAERRIIERGEVALLPERK